MCPCGMRRHGKAKFIRRRRLCRAEEEKEAGWRQGMEQHGLACENMIIYVLWHAKEIRNMMGGNKDIWFCTWRAILERNIGR